ncbi:PucR family transcriptional regulator [Paenibacillus aceris]|uniref:Purine catabolism regulator n=1 Tax=Paenibacillus aceris TaxID=869555 RepID=A0ABS4HQV1_9BACL|nr:PucR family transcriptional regulator [Paenibacillus aceris]MBP1960989.1 purine catabolism regulator [Paenibacillus aceris]NHW35346.1 PucR family transcriptional regulator [Paenibacillus aceris]
MVQTLLLLTVRDILQRPLFQNAEAIATEEALNRTVRWVHIMEVPQVGDLLNGNELILNTGIGWYNNEELSLSFLQQLINSGASGLCIELGTYTKHPLERMKELALREHFPLIFFHEQVRYIDITQDLHAYFIHQHYNMVSELEALSKQLNQLLLSGRGLQPLLKLLQQTTQVQVAFFPFGEEARFIPEMPKAEADAFYEKWIFGEIFRQPDRKSKLAHRPILALERLFADLLLYGEQELSEFQILALDRFATAIAQEMMRTAYMEEKKRYKQDLWVTGWLSGKHTHQDIRDYMLALKPAIKLDRAVACVFDNTSALQGVNDHETHLRQTQMLARSIFEGEGFYSVPAFYDSHIVFVLLDQLGSVPIQDRILKAIQRLRKTEVIHESGHYPPIWGIGTIIRDPSLLKESYETALDTIEIQKDSGIREMPFYHELHVNKIMLTMKQSGRLAAFIDEYLGSLVTYDIEKNGQLLKTLKMYLALSGSKQETAKELFIVRQTLYHRLDKITRLLGEDFMRSDKRMAIELALHGYEYLHGAIG